MRKGNIIRILAGLGLFAVAYALINSELLIQSILYRIAANDSDSAVIAIASIALQSLILLALTILLPRRFFWCLLALVGISGVVNIAYSGILNEVVDIPKTAWMIAEMRQSTNAAGQFTGAFAIAVLKTVCALGLLMASRTLLRSTAQPLFGGLWFKGKICVFLSVIALGVFALVPASLNGAVSSERNIFVYAAQILIAEPAPDRALVDVDPDSEHQIEKIFWLIDESISHDIFQKVIQPDLAPHHPANFGKTWALGNCSTPANVALRSGVNVIQVTDKTDLRATPSIWRYAQKAGYKTSFFDGQVNGAPQNMLLPPERALIDEYEGVADGLDTDRKMAAKINATMKSPGKQFVYTVLRGVHFQYTDHYPGGEADKDLPLADQYEQAVRYSKKGFFDELLAGVDRNNVAIIYTSDHGQKIKDGSPPHCSAQPSASEFSIPLIAFTPQDTGLGDAQPGQHSASQIFPTTLLWMGFPAEYARSRYDNDLSGQSKRLIWFGRNVTPVNAGDRIDVNIIPKG